MFVEAAEACACCSREHRHARHNCGSEVLLTSLTKLAAPSILHDIKIFSPYLKQTTNAITLSEAGIVCKYCHQAKTLTQDVRSRNYVRSSRNIQWY